MIVFDDMIADMLGNKKLNPIVTELFISRRKLFTLFLSPNITLLFCKILIQLQHTISLKKFQTKESFNKSHLIIHQILTLNKEICKAKPYLFLVIDTTLVSDNSSRFRKNLLERI